MSKLAQAVASGVKESDSDETPEVETEEGTEVEEVEPEDADTDGEGDGEDNDDEEVVPVKDLENVKKALENERTKSKDLAKANRDLKRQLKEATVGKPDDVDTQKVVAEAEKNVAKYRDIAVRKEAALALQDAGAKVKASRLIKLLDLAEVDIDDDGNVDGLQDAIEELKADSPEFFKSDEDEVVTTTTRKPAVKKVGSIDSGPKQTPQPKLSVAQKMARESGLSF